MDNDPKFVERFEHNFLSLQTAVLNNRIVLVSALRKADNQPVALLCAVNESPGEIVELVPLAQMIDGNPYEMFSQPSMPNIDVKTYSRH